MILEKKPKININRLNPSYLPNPTQDSMDFIKEFAKIENTYRGAMKEISTKLEVLDNEFQVTYDHNPIHHIECRMKSVHSIVEKLKRKNLELSINAIVENIMDIAGVRVICNYVDDIYKLTDLLLSQADIILIRQTDYIDNPKPNGYRSLHLVVRVPVVLSNRTELVPVEVQLRSIVMDMWASLEHELHYKSDKLANSCLLEKLKLCSEDLWDIDLRMQDIFRSLPENIK